ncbi:MAG: hypothetical protein U0531_01040 [Dehalococcoidia bacterium]
MVATDPAAQRRRFVVDTLTIHQSAALVAWVAETSAWDGDLGVKGMSGVLHARRGRAAFL